MQTDPVVTLWTFKTHIDADLAKGTLEVEGIDAVVSADDAGGEQPGMWVGNGVRLLVRQEDAERAAEILNLNVNNV